MSSPTGRRSIRLRGPLDLRRTLGVMRVSGRDPTWRLAAADAIRAVRNPDGPTTLQLAVRGDRLDATAWGSGTDWELAHVDRLVGEHDSRRGFEPRRHELVRRMDLHNPGARVGAGGAAFAAVVAAVLGQRVTAREGFVSWSRLIRSWGEPAPGPDLAGHGAGGLWIIPEPAAWAGRHSSAYHRFGVERGRADTIRNAARHAARIDAISDPAELRRVFALLPGIGPWTESQVRFGSLGDPDAVLVGDLHVPHQVCFALAGEERGSDERMIELLEPFAGHRGRVQRMIGWSGIAAPRRAPRYSPIPIATW